jgi:ribonuclease P protein component
VLSLRRRKDIDRAFQEGARVSSRWAVLHARRRGEDEAVPPVPRLAVIAGRRFANAVARNRARRLLRETCRVVLGRRPAPWDLVLVARTEVLESTPPERLAAIRKLFDNAGVLAEGDRGAQTAG